MGFGTRTGPAPGQPGQQGQGGQPPIVKDQLPSTGLQRQMGSLQKQYGNMGDPRALGANQNPNAAPPKPQFGSSSLDVLSNRLAQSYGLATGGTPLFDSQGNPLMTPQQISEKSGGKETWETASMKMQMISEGITKQQNIDQQAKGTAALQTGLGLVQKRGQGSLATLQSGAYQALAQQYANQEYQAADFSYWIAESGRRREEQRMRKAQKASKWGAIGGAIGGIVGIFAGSPEAGAKIGSGLGSSAASW